MQASEGPALEPSQAGTIRKRRARIAVLLVALAVGGALSVFVVSLPPALTVADGSTLGALSGNFSTYSGEPLLAWLNATTYANQTSGPTSTVSLGLIVIVQYNSADGTIHVGIRVNLLGRFAANVRPDALALACNQTGPDSHVDSQATDQEGENVSFDGNAAIGILDNGTGRLTVSLVNHSGSGPFYDFRYSDTFLMTIRYPYNHFLGFRAVVSGWFLPSIGVGILLKIIHDPGGIWA